LKNIFEKDLRQA